MEQTAETMRTRFQAIKLFAPAVDGEPPTPPSVRGNTQTDVRREGKAEDVMLPAVYNFLLRDAKSFEAPGEDAIGPRPPPAMKQPPFAIEDDLDALVAMARARGHDLDSLDLVGVTKERDPYLGGANENAAGATAAHLPGDAEGRRSESAPILTVVMTKLTSRDFWATYLDLAGKPRPFAPSCSVDWPDQAGALLPGAEPERVEASSEDTGLPSGSMLGNGRDVLTAAIKREGCSVCTREDCSFHISAESCVKWGYVPCAPKATLMKGVRPFPKVEGDKCALRSQMEHFCDIPCVGMDHCTIDSVEPTAPLDLCAAIQKEAMSQQTPAVLIPSCAKKESRLHLLSRERFMRLSTALVNCADEMKSRSEPAQLYDVLKREASLSESVCESIFVDAQRSPFLSTGGFKTLPDLASFMKSAQHKDAISDCRKFFCHNAENIYLDWSLIQEDGCSAHKKHVWESLVFNSVSHKAVAPKPFSLSVQMRKEGALSYDGLKSSLSYQTVHSTKCGEEVEEMAAQICVQNASHSACTSLEKANTYAKKVMKRRKIAAQHKNFQGQHANESPAVQVQSVVSNTVGSRPCSENEEHQDSKHKTLFSRQPEFTSTTDFQGLLKKFCVDDAGEIGSINNPAEWLDNVPGERADEQHHAATGRSETLYGEEPQAWGFGSWPDDVETHAPKQHDGGGRLGEDIFKHAVPQGPSRSPPVHESAHLSSRRSSILRGDHGSGSWSLPDLEDFEGLFDRCANGTETLTARRDPYLTDQSTPQAPQSWDSRSILDNWNQYRKSRHYPETSQSFLSRKRRKRTKAWGTKRF